jgi:hypothetical protein
MHAISLILLLISGLAFGASDLGPVFPTLLDSSLNSSAPTKSVSGDTASGKVGNVGFSFIDSSSNLVLPQLNSASKQQTSVYDMNGVGILSSFGSAASGLRVAAVLGNSSGEVDYGYGNAGPGTQRTVSIPSDGTRSSYSAAILGLVVANTPTDVFTIQGSATKTVRITRIGISGTQNTSAIRDIVFIKRSSADSGGTSTTATLVPHDSNNAAATAVVRSYTVNPSSLGTAVGNIRTIKFDLEATNLVGSSDHMEIKFGDNPSQAIVLRGSSEFLCLNLNSVTSSTNSFNFYVEFTEE